jgi:hypothetical protein
MLQFDWLKIFELDCHWKLSKSVLFVEHGPPNELEIRTEKKWFLAFVPLPVMSIIFLERVSSRWCIRRPLILQQNGEDSILIFVISVTENVFF